MAYKTTLTMPLVPIVSGDTFRNALAAASVAFGLAAGGATLYSRVQSDSEAIEHYKAHVHALDEFQNKSGERIARIEQAQMDTNKSLERIESKIDWFREKIRR